MRAFECALSMSAEKIVGLFTSFSTQQYSVAWVVTVSRALEFFCLVCYSRHRVQFFSCATFCRVHKTGVVVVEHRSSSFEQINSGEFEFVG